MEKNMTINKTVTLAVIACLGVAAAGCKTLSAYKKPETFQTLTVKAVKTFPPMDNVQPFLPMDKLIALSKDKQAHEIISVHLTDENGDAVALTDGWFENFEVESLFMPQGKSIELKSLTKIETKPDGTTTLTLSGGFEFPDDAKLVFWSKEKQRGARYAVDIGVGSTLNVQKVGEGKYRLILPKTVWPSPSVPRNDDQALTIPFRTTHNPNATNK